MALPTLEQYNQALQHPDRAFTDPELQRGQVRTTGLGLPFAVCGGFALTYEISSGGRKYAVRCFHRESKGLENRYAAISAKIKQLRSPYFVDDFSFQAQGFRFNNLSAPILKMAWANGETLGRFVEDNYDKSAMLGNLRVALADLAIFLENNNMAHGDIQPGNVMVTDKGRKVQLIDYDGMYVDALRAAGSAEAGVKNFQHPQRSKQWGPHLDRFSFIVIDLSLSLLENEPKLWRKTASDADAFLFRANDLCHPDSSSLFRELQARSKQAGDVKKFINICKSPFDAVPSLAEYRGGASQSGQVSGRVSVSVTPSAAPSGYISSFSVLDATDYGACLRHVGDKVELIGKIQEVQDIQNRCIFMNFGRTGQFRLVRLSIWSAGLANFRSKPDRSWEGKWVSVSGLLEPPFKASGYESISITIEHPSQLHEIAGHEAAYRLGKAPSGGNVGVRGSKSKSRLIKNPWHSFISSINNSWKNIKSFPRKCVSRLIKNPWHSFISSINNSWKNFKSFLKKYIKLGLALVLSGIIGYVLAYIHNSVEYSRSKSVIQEGMQESSSGDGARTTSVRANPQPPKAVPPAAEADWTNAFGMEFMRIPGGTFQMGCSSKRKNCHENERPQHQVTISSYYIGRHEVTQAQWRKVMDDDNPSRFNDDPNCPVERVNWYDAERFIWTLNAKKPVQENGNRLRYRLPTEAEWEYAARAESAATYSFGDDQGQLNAHAWCADKSGTHPVGVKRPNAWGLYDMYGNVYEWVQDWYSDYAAADATNPKGPSEGRTRVLRGGSWGDDGLGNCRSSRRMGMSPGDSNEYVGFRVALVPED